MLIATIVLVASFFVARFIYERLNLHFDVASGGEYLLLGIVLGPQVSGVLSAPTLNSLAPVATLGLGWVGALLGSAVVVPRLAPLAARRLGMAALQSLLTLVILSVVVGSLLYLAGITSAAGIAIPAVALSAVTTTSRFWLASRAEAGVAGETVGSRLAVTKALHCVIALAAFGLLFAAAHPPNGSGRALSPAEWAVIGIAIGVVGGVLFRLFLGSHHSGDHLFVSMIGAITLVSGAAMYLQLSPTLSAMIFGAVLVNSASAAEDIKAALDRVGQPLYFGLLVLAGAEWQSPGASAILPLVLMLLTAIIAKIAVVRFTMHRRRFVFDPAGDWGHRLIGGGGLALAMGLDYTYQDVHPLGSFVLTAAIAVLLASDLLAMRRVP